MLAHKLQQELHSLYIVYGFGTSARFLSLSRFMCKMDFAGSRKSKTRARNKPAAFITLSLTEVECVPGTSYSRYRFTARNFKFPAFTLSFCPCSEFPLRRKLRIFSSEEHLITLRAICTTYFLISPVT